MSRKKTEAVGGTGSDWVGLVQRRAPGIAVALVALATLRIVTTYPVFNHTIDEPGHIAAGIEWLDKGRYVLDPHHPPLSRLMMAIGPYLDGARAAGRADVHREGAAILYGPDGSAYDRRLTLARLGILPFFWLACAVVYLGCVRWLDRATAAIAVFLLTFQPAILAHGGLATTDMALTAMLGAALYAFLRLVEEPTVARGAVLGLWSGFAILSKFTAIPFFAVCVTAVGVLHAIRTRPALGKAARAAQRLAIPVAAGLAVVAVVIWAGYRFAIGPNPFTGITMPAPRFFDGIAQIMDHVDKGHPSYLLGMTSQKGFWYYYPVALAVKLPLPLVALTIMGMAMCWRKAEARYWIPVSLAAGLLGFSLWSTVNIGIRHVMPLLLLFSVIGAVAVTQLLRARQQWMPKAAIGLVAWLGVTSALSHPDYLAYFNAIAGDEPEKILVDSDLDWGQDMKRLAARLQRSNAQQVYFNPLILAHLEAVHGFPPISPTNPAQPEPGWTAVSLTILKATRLSLFQQEPDIDPWPNRIKPMERVGKGVYLYYFRPQQGSR